MHTLTPYGRVPAYAVLNKKKKKKKKCKKKKMLFCFTFFSVFSLNSDVLISVTFAIDFDFYLLKVIYIFVCRSLGLKELVDSAARCPDLSGRPDFCKLKNRDSINRPSNNQGVRLITELLTE